MLLTSSPLRRRQARALARLTETAALWRSSCSSSLAARPDLTAMALAISSSTLVASSDHAPAVSMTIGRKVTPWFLHASSVPLKDRFFTIIIRGGREGSNCSLGKSLLSPWRRDGEIECSRKAPSEAGKVDVGRSPGLLVLINVAWSGGKEQAGTFQFRM